MSDKVDNEESAKFSNLYHDPDLLTVKEREKVKKEVVLIKDPTMTPQISDDLLKEVAFRFYQEMLSNDSWVEKYEKETGKSAYEKSLS